MFVAVAEHLGFTRAAASLGVTVSAVSMQIQALEEYLGLPLFRRQGRSVQLTAEAVQLLPKVRDNLMALHSERISEGTASVIFGLASFGEGLDLAGSLLEKLWVLKLPFGQPDDPVGQIVGAARKRRCDLIVVAADGHNAFVRLVTGSLVSGLITRSSLPVLVCKAVEQMGAALPARHRLRPRSRRRAGIDLHH